MRRPCAEFDEQIIMLAYGRLDATRRRLLESHVAVCEECRRELDELRALRAHLDSEVESVAPPRIDEDAFIQRVVTTVHAQPVVGEARRRPSSRRSKRISSARRARVRSRRRFGSVAALAAAAALLVGAGLTWLALRGPADPGSREKGPERIVKTVKEQPRVALPEILDRAREARTAGQLRALADPLAQLIDHEAATGKADLRRWSHLSSAEILSRLADRPSFSAAVVADLELAAAVRLEKAEPGDARSLRLLRAELGDESATGEKFLSSLRPGSNREVIMAQRLLARRVRRALGAEVSSAAEWKRARGAALPEPADGSKGLSAAVAIARGDLAAATFDFDRAISSWLTAEAQLAAGNPELAAGLRLRICSLTHLVRRRARDARDGAKALAGKYRETAAARKYGAALAKAFEGELHTERKTAGAFLAAMGIPFEVRRCAVPFDTLPQYTMEVSAEPRPVNAVILRKFLMPFKVRGLGRGTVVHGSIRFWAKSAEKPLKVNIWSLPAGIKTPQPQGSFDLVHGLTYRFRLALWRPVDRKSPVKLCVTFTPEGARMKPLSLSTEIGAVGKAGSKELMTCDVLCSGNNVSSLDLLSPSLRTDLDLSKPLE
jgi:hypothetical protein